MQLCQLAVTAGLALTLLPVASHGVTNPEHQACDAWFSARSLRDPAAFHAPQPSIGCFDGRIAMDTVPPLLDWLAKQEPAGTALVIRSPGGDVKAGLPIGRRVLAARIKVYARDLCASSCANYVFMLGREPEALPDSLVVYHGGISPEFIIEAAGIVKDHLRNAEPQFADREVKKATGELEQLLLEQRKLYADAGLQVSFLERFDLISFDAIAEKNCTPTAAAKPASYVALTSQQYQQVGVRASGDIIEDVEHIQRLVNRLGKTDTGICLAPAELFEREAK
jgi:hypothetical protein